MISLESIQSEDLKKLVLDFGNNNNFQPEKIYSLVEDTDELTLLRILARFRETLVETLKNIKMGIRADNGEIVWKACHKISSSCELLGLQKVSALARELTYQLKAHPDIEGNLQEINVLIGDLNKTLEKIDGNFPSLNSYL